MSLEWRNRARERRLARRQQRKLFKSGAKQPPQVYAAYLDGLVHGAQIREAQEARIDDIATVDIFGAPVTGLAKAPAMMIDDEDADDRLPVVEGHYVLH